MTRLKDLISKGGVPAEALRVLSYIAENKEVTTTRLKEHTKLSRTTLYRHLILLKERGLIVINVKIRPSICSLSEEGLRIWEEE